MVENFSFGSKGAALDQLSERRAAVRTKLARARGDLEDLVRRQLTIGQRSEAKALQASAAIAAARQELADIDQEFVELVHGG